MNKNNGLISLLNKNINEKPIIKLQDIEEAKTHKLLNIKKIQTKFGEAILTEFEKFKCFLPRRMNDSVLSNLEDFTKLVKTQSVYLVKNTRLYGVYSPFSFKYNLDNENTKKLSTTPAVSESSDEDSVPKKKAKKNLKL